MNTKQGFILDYLRTHVTPINPDGTEEGAQAHATTIKVALNTANVLWKSVEKFTESFSMEPISLKPSELGELLEKLKGSDGAAIVGVRGVGSMSELKEMLKAQGLPTDSINTGFKGDNCGLAYGEFIAEALIAKGAKVSKLHTGLGAVNIELELDGVALQLQVKQGGTEDTDEL